MVAYRTYFKFLPLEKLNNIQMSIFRDKFPFKNIKIFVILILKQRILIIRFFKYKRKWKEKVVPYKYQKYYWLLLSVWLR